MIDLKDYGFNAKVMTDDVKGTPARIIAVHKGRYKLICEYGQIYGKVKASIYYNDQGESFPTSKRRFCINSIQ